jgi:hypothetical protein
LRIERVAQFQEVPTGWQLNAFAKKASALLPRRFLLDKGLLMLPKYLHIFTQIFVFSAVWFSLQHPEGEGFL